jgi:hypothetical protein
MAAVEHAQGSAAGQPVLWSFAAFVLAISHRAVTLVLMSEVTQLLDAIDHGDRQAAGELLPLVYEELRKLAAVKMAQERPGQTLQPTALVHEAWLRLAGD